MCKIIHNVIIISTWKDRIKIKKYYHFLVFFYFLLYLKLLFTLNYITNIWLSLFLFQLYGVLIVYILMFDKYNYYFNDDMLIIITTNNRLGK